MCQIAAPARNLKKKKFLRKDLLASLVLQRPSELVKLDTALFHNRACLIFKNKA